MTEQDTIDRDEVARKVRDEMVRLMSEHGFVISAKQFPFWRPTLRVKGTIPGVWDYVEIIATDGLLGYFLNGSDVVVGHVQMFDGDVKSLFSVPKIEERTRKPRKKSKRQQIIDSL